MPPWTASPAPTGARYTMLVGPRCVSASAPPAFGAVAENPNTSESFPACTVSSIPIRDDSDAVRFRYAAAMLTSTSSTRGVVPRFLNRWFGGRLASKRSPTSTNAPYCQDDGSGADCAATMFAPVSQAHMTRHARTRKCHASRGISGADRYRSCAQAPLERRRRHHRGDDHDRDERGIPSRVEHRRTADPQRAAECRENQRHFTARNHADADRKSADAGGDHTHAACALSRA